MANKKAVGTDYVPVNYGQQNTEYKHKTKKKKTKKTSPKTFWLIKASPGVAVIALIFLISLALVAQHVWINFLGYQISQLNNSITDIEENNQKLRFEIASLGSLDRIEKVAINELGMIHPKDIQYVFPKEIESKQKSIQIADFNSPTIQTKVQSDELQNPPKAWLGTVQDFFFNYLMGESKS